MGTNICNIPMLYRLVFNLVEFCMTSSIPLEDDPCISMHSSLRNGSDMGRRWGNRDLCNVSSEFRQFLQRYHCNETLEDPPLKLTASLMCAMKRDGRSPIETILIYHDISINRNP